MDRQDTVDEADGDARQVCEGAHARFTAANRRTSHTARFVCCASCHHLSLSRRYASARWGGLATPPGLRVQITAYQE